MGGIAGGGANPFGAAIDTSEMNVSALARSLLGRSASADMRSDLECAAASHTHAVANLSDASANGKSLISAADYSAMRTLLGLVIGTDVLAPNGSGANLTGISAGKLGQVVSSLSGAVATGTTTTPTDDTIPQSGEGTEFFTLAITPANASSNLLVLIPMTWSCSAQYPTTVALHKDSDADAVAAAHGLVSYNGLPDFCTVAFLIAAGSTSARTYKVRIGPSTSSTITINGHGGARKLGGVCQSGIIIAEILP